ncbi:MAG: enoyl-CoA hydratase/isomerase family protein, partial [Deltaproteobacteria bacterium]|nr:enoyl-CoA hydratase/isomerase family protein [Deltaproteobacteria bacterium]
MIFNTLIVEKKEGILSVTLNRPEVRNAFNAELIADLTGVFTREAAAADVRVVVLSGAGEVFCAGGDIKWMKEGFNHSHGQNLEEARRLAVMLQTINET